MPMQRVCMCVVLVLQVRWPTLFVEFMRSLDVLVPEFLSVVPAECIADQTFGFYLEFLFTFCMPIVRSLILGSHSALCTLAIAHATCMHACALFSLWHV